MIKTILKHYLLDRTIKSIFDNIINTFTTFYKYVDGKTYPLVHVTFGDFHVILFHALYKANVYIENDYPWIPDGYYSIFYYQTYQLEGYNKETCADGIRKKV
jgi:hypothetical protein